MLLDTLTTPFSRALRGANSSAGTFASLNIQAERPNPFNQDSLTGIDGVYSMGEGGIYTVNRLQLIPYADAAGAQFSLRLYGWDSVAPPDASNNLIVWVPFLIAELACTTSNRSGVTGHYVNDTEYAVDTIVLTQGTTGNNGFAGGLINSTGPGTDLIAYALITLSGCQFIQFDFQQTDSVSMNCLWARS